MKRGSAYKVIATSIILLITLSFASATLLGDLLNAFGFPGGPTGNVINEDGSGCNDYDVNNNPATTASKVILDGTEYPDTCSGDTAIDNYCYWVDTTNADTDTGSSIYSVSLSLIKTAITGMVVGLEGGKVDQNVQPGGDINGYWTVRSSSYDCAQNGLPCAYDGPYGGCGCNPDTYDPVACGPIDLDNPEQGICSLGEITCQQDQTLSDCVGAVYPDEEICDAETSLDENCNGIADKDDPDAEAWCVQQHGEGWYCNPQLGQRTDGCIKGNSLFCTDNDKDGWGNPANPQCEHPELDCDDNDPSVYPGAPEICGDGIDSNCNIEDDDLDPKADAWCLEQNPNFPEKQKCVKNIQDVNMGSFVIECGIANECTDMDSDGYGSEEDVGCANKPNTDCEDANKYIFPNGDPNFDTPLNPNTFCDCDNSDGYDKGTEESLNAGNCGDGFDNDCDGKIDEEDTDCQNLPPCTDEDGDYYAAEDDLSKCKYTDASVENAVSGVGAPLILGPNDCDDSDESTNPGLDEVCDGVDNDCSGKIDDISMAIDCVPADSSSNSGDCKVFQSICLFEDDYASNPRMQVCEDLDGGAWTTPLSVELSSCNNINDDCSNGIDNGVNCGCNQGDTRDCEEDGDPCTKGIQTCSQSTWGNCEETKIDDCQAECTDGAVCGSNVGACSKGFKDCIDGKWGECIGGRKAVPEICADAVDNDCDGTVDEPSCTIVATDSNDDHTLDSTDKTNPNYDSKKDPTSPDYNPTYTGDENDKNDQSPFGELGSDNSRELGLFEKLFKFFIGLFRVGQSIAGYSISETDTITTQPSCIDSDGGKNYFTFGSGQGQTASGINAVFEDFCYKGSQSSRVSKCGGEDCRLLEYYCDGNTIRSDQSVICEYGCYNGACVPDLSLSDECDPVFDKEIWAWKNPCA